MAKIQHIDHAPIFVDSIINEDRAVYEPSHAGTLANDVAHVRESPEQIDMIEQRITETRGSRVFIERDILHYPGQIAQSFFREDDAVIH